VTQHLNEFNTITNQLSSVDIDFDNEIHTLIVLASLSNSWEAIRIAMSNSTGKSKLKYEDIRYLILSEEMYRRDSSKASCSDATLNLERRGRGYGKNSGRGRSRSRKGKSESGSGNQPKCWNCGKIGHFKKNCKKPRKKTGNNSANVVIEKVYDALILFVNSPLDSWVLDSGASFHPTAIHEVLEKYVAENFFKVFLANGSALDIVGMCDVRIRVHSDLVWKLQKVRHVSELKENLISMGQLDEEWHAISFYGSKWKVSTGAKILARGYKIGTIYMTTSIR
jgi:hypothetical protein